MIPEMALMAVRRPDIIPMNEVHRAPARGEGLDVLDVEGGVDGQRRPVAREGSSTRAMIQPIWSRAPPGERVAEVALVEENSERSIERRVAV
ncbi:MAG: hypothetical protein IPN17_12405 [Deltaproteobacteria bacterium]|nr:hypothetical protein [Deltaproteobacteria bacterium]